MRVFRLIRTVRVFRVIRAMRDLRVMFVRLTSSLDTLLWSLVLLGLMVFFFSVFFCQSVAYHMYEYGDSVEHFDDFTLWFGSLLMSTFTLYQCVLGGISW